MRARRHRSRITEKDLAAELRAHRDDRDEWDEAPVQAEVGLQRAVVTSVRLPVAEFMAVQKAAKATGQTVSEFVRSAIAMRLHERVLINAVEIATGSSSEAPSHATFLAPALEAGRTQNPGPARTERIPIPHYANLTR